MKSESRYKPGDKIGGRYLAHEVKSGGMGEVYLCFDLDTKKPYALKTFQKRFSIDLRIQVLFEEEMALWVAMEKHPNIVRCLSVEIIDDSPFMVLEWIASDESRGTDLRSWLRRGPLDLRLALDFTIDICRGLMHAQQKQPGIVHRDLKPENILIAQRRLAKITDFGLATIVQRANLTTADAQSDTGERQSLLNANGMVGTPSYMAPEQWRNEPLDNRADIYSIGCILYELLTGQRPFIATTLTDLRNQHLTTPVPSLTKYKNLPTKLDTIMAYCLAKRREERFTTVNELLEELSSIYQQQFSEPPRAIDSTGPFTNLDYCNRAITFMKLKRYDEALADFAQAIQLNPTFSLAYYGRGTLYKNLHYFERALADFAQVIRLDPTFVPTYINRGVTYQNLEQHDEALVDFTQAIQLDSADSEAYTNRGNILGILRRYSEALADHNQAIYLNPIFAQAYVNRGVIYDKLQRYEEALTDYDRAVQLDPGLAEAYCNAGNIYANRGALREALSNYERAAQLGLPEGVRNAARVREELMGAPPQHSTPDRRSFDLAIDSLLQAQSLTEMRELTKQFPFITDPDFIKVGMQAVAPMIPLRHKPDFEQRMTWLRQIAVEQQQVDLGNKPPLPQDDIFGLRRSQQAYEAFKEVASVDGMRRVVSEFPFMTDRNFIAFIEQLITLAPPLQKSKREQCLAWLRQIASEQKREVK